MKKNKIFLKLITFFSMLSLFTSCSKIVVGFQFPEYTISGNQSSLKDDLEKDEGMVLDGVLDEKEWRIAESNAYSVVSSISSDVRLKSMAYLGEKGVYFGIEVDDFAVYYNSERKTSRNSSVELHFKGFGDLETKAYCIRILPTGDGVKVDYNESTWRLNLNGLGKMQWMTSPFSWEGAAFVKGNINTSSCEGYVCEAFVPWSVLGVSNFKYVRTYTAFNHVETASTDDNSRIWTGTDGCLLTKPNTWKIASNHGLVEYDDIIDELVTADNGMVVDGTLDELVWNEVQDANFEYKTASGKVIKLSSKSYMSEKGAYFGFVIKDNYVYYADETVRPIGLNSGMEIMFAPYGVDSITLECLQLRITANNVRVGYSGVLGENYPWSFDQFEMLSATTIQDNNGEGGLNSNKNEGFTIEIFIPWTSFGSNTPLDGVMVLPNVVHSENATQSEKISPWDYCNVTNAPVHLQMNPQDYFIYMEKDGAVLRRMEIPNLFFTSSMLNEESGYYEYDFEVKADFIELNDKSTSEKHLVNPTFELPEDLIVVSTGNGQFKAKVHKDNINKFKDGIEFVVDCNGNKQIARAYFSEICVDGNPNDEKYGNAYNTLTNVSENIVKQKVSTYFGEKGIFVGYVVKDKYIKNNSHVETIFSFGDEVQVGNTYQIRYYPYSNKIKTYSYQTPASDGWAWFEQSGDYKLDVIGNSKITDDGYLVEMFIPYETFNLSGAPSKMYILPVISYYKDNSTLVTSQYHNQTGVSNYYTWNRTNFVEFDNNGYVSKQLFVEDIFLTDNQLVDGYYVSDVVCKDDQNNHYGIKEIKNYTSYFIKDSNGNYQLKVPQDSIDELLGQKIQVVGENDQTYEMEVSLLSKSSAEAYIDFTNGTLTNSGSNDSLVIKSTVLSTNSFMDTDSVTYTTGIDNDENGAILTNNRNGAYTNISGLDFGTNDFTISTWINIPSNSPISTGNSSYLFGTSNVDTCADGFRVTVRKTDSGFYYNVRSSYDPNATLVISETMSYGEWHNVILVRQNDKLHLYVDSNLLVTLNISSDTNFTSSTLSFGAYYGDSWTYHNGNIAFDNIGVYSMAIDSKGIENIYNNQI